MDTVCIDKICIISLQLYREFYLSIKLGMDNQRQTADSMTFFDFDNMLWLRITVPLASALTTNTHNRKSDQYMCDSLKRRSRLHQTTIWLQGLYCSRKMRGLRPDIVSVVGHTRV